jgi:hypothetical protein
LTQTQQSHRLNAALAARVSYLTHHQQHQPMSKTRRSNKTMTDRSESTRGEQGHPIAEGDLVITWYDDEPVRYGGPGDGGPFTTLTFGVLDGRTPVRTCGPELVAPASTPIPALDARVAVINRPRSERPYGAAGTWRLTLPGQPPSWHRTKRDGTATGLRQVAILDWHAARAAQIPAASPDYGRERLQEDRHLPRDR